MWKYRMGKEIWSSHLLSRATIHTLQWNPISSVKCYHWPWKMAKRHANDFEAPRALATATWWNTTKNKTTKLENNLKVEQRVIVMNLCDRYEPAGGLFCLSVTAFNSQIWKCIHCLLVKRGLESGCFVFSFDLQFLWDDIEILRLRHRCIVFNLWSASRSWAYPPIQASWQWLDGRQGSKSTFRLEYFETQANWHFALLPWFAMTHSSSLALSKPALWGRDG